MTATPLLELRGINKSFGPVQVLRNVDFSAYPGEVTALVGDNGAGKSTLVKCVGGIYPIDSGTYLFDGQVATVHSPRDAGALGVEIVYQDLALCENLDIVQNMFLGRERLRRRLLDEDSMERAAAETLSSLRVTTVRSIRQPVASLSGGQRQSVAVAKTVMWNSRVCLLDEPTAALGVVQTRMVLDLIRRLRDHGLAVMLISHNLNDVFEVADRIAVLHLGSMVVEGPVADFDRQSTVEYMTTGKGGRSSTPAAATNGAAG